jgi:hypothetical protein
MLVVTVVYDFAFRCPYTLDGTRFTVVAEGVVLGNGVLQSNEPTVIPHISSIHPCIRYNLSQSAVLIKPIPCAIPLHHKSTGIQPDHIGRIVLKRPSAL